MSLALALALATPAFAGHPPGVVLEDAVVVDVTTDGLDALGELGLEFVPSELALPGIGSGGTDWFCFTDDYFGLFDALIHMEVTRLSIRPTPEGVLRAELDLSVSLNDEVAPMLVEYDAFCLEGACDAWVQHLFLGATVEEVSRRFGVPVSELLASLSIMEVRGEVVRLPGQRYAPGGSPR